MASIGAEVGQKMRSAIKAKLLELNCYVDDELPDYVMVMVANKRTKSQMKEDLQLFLSNKTATFVDWLHIVLKKLKEVTVTNPDIIKKTAKRKVEEVPNIPLKKEKKAEKKVKKEPGSNEEIFRSLTDDLPINANKLAEQRKIIVMKENRSNMNVMQDNFDIPPLSEVNMSTEEELEDLEKKIKNVKSRLGLLVESEEEEEDCIKLKPEPDELLPPQLMENKISKTELLKKTENSSTLNQKKPEHSRITFEENDSSTIKRRSVMERLGKRRSSGHEDISSQKKNRIDLSGFRKDDDNKPRNSRETFKEGVLNRLGVMSKVSVPNKPPEEPEEPLKTREVPSMVRIKPRIIPYDAPQANKNLLLKAVAEAQRSIAQTPSVGHNMKPDALYTRRYREKFTDQQTNKKLSEDEKNKIKKLLSSTPDNVKDGGNAEYVPSSLSKSVENAPTYIPSSKSKSDSETSLENGKTKQKFIVTLDGIEKTKFKDLVGESENSKPSVRSRLDKKKSPSPIIFDKPSVPVKIKSNIPDKLPIVQASPSVKNKERCKYWPSCKLGDKCEFVHPNTNCEKFPHCKFGDKCLFLHPNCKFGSSCTRRDCVYSHSTVTKTIGAATSSQQICKFFPNCVNVNCTFLHPKPCKFGKFCKNQAECNFSHNFVPIKSSLTWRSK